MLNKDITRLQEYVIKKACTSTFFFLKKINVIIIEPSKYKNGINYSDIQKFHINDLRPHKRSCNHFIFVP